KSNKNNKNNILLSSCPAKRWAFFLLIYNETSKNDSCRPVHMACTKRATLSSPLPGYASFYGTAPPPAFFADPTHHHPHWSFICCSTLELSLVQSILEDHLFGQPTFDVRRYYRWFFNPP